MRQIFTLISCLNIFLITTAQTSKAEGETIIVFRCRATSSLNEPLLVIDGVIKDKFDLKEIDPNDIESLNILKDATAAAIYGCRASSGVIIITTKNANQRVIKVKDIFSGEILPNATVELNYNENGNNISLYQQTDSLGCFITNKIVYGKEYELKVSSVGYKTFMAHINSKIVRKNYSVLLERNYSQLKEAIVTSTICYKKSTKIKGSSSAPEMCGYLGCGIGGISIIKTLSEENSATTGAVRFKVYPNPVLRSQRINLEFISENERKLTLRLFDLNGKLIESKEYSVAEGTNTTNYTVDPKFTPGLYIVQIGDANKKLIKSEKLVIQ